MVTAPNAGMSAASGYFVDAVRQQAERAGISGDQRRIPRLHDARSGASARGRRRRSSTERIASKRRRDTSISRRPRRRTTRRNYLQAMAVAVDPFTGDVRALVGGRNYARAPFNRAIDGDASARLVDQADRLRKGDRGQRRGEHDHSRYGAHDRIAWRR